MLLEVGFTFLKHKMKLPMPSLNKLYHFKYMHEYMRVFQESIVHVPSKVPLLYELLLARLYMHILHVYDILVYGKRE